jgi:hypothetical protein
MMASAQEGRVHALTGIRGGSRARAAASPGSLPADISTGAPKPLAKTSEAARLLHIVQHELREKVTEYGLAPAPNS